MAAVRPSRRATLSATFMEFAKILTYIYTMRLILTIMPNKASLGTEHTPNVESSRRKHSTDVDLQVDVEQLHADVAKTTKNYDHL
ncbi:hypothetical protein GBA52_010419 [Prunus armeniaca]|nr:hypothetical protein GBA52_010419 [Prunus armeniaca]